MALMSLLTMALLLHSGLLIAGQNTGDVNSSTAQWRKATVKNSAGVHRALLNGLAAFSGQSSRAIFFLDCSEDGTASLHLRVADSIGFDVGDFEGEGAIGSNGKLLSYSIDGNAAILHTAGGYGATPGTFDFIFMPSQTELTALTEATGKRIVFTIHSPVQKPSMTAEFILPPDSTLLREVSAPFLKGAASIPSTTTATTRRDNQDSTVVSNDTSNVPVQASSRFEISGIGLGTPIQAALTKIGSGFRLINIQMQGKDAASIAAASAQTSVIAIKGATEEVWVFEALKGSLTYIDHFVQFENNQEPSLTDTRQRLIDKFGEPSSLPNRQSPQWIYDSNNAHISSSAINNTASPTLLHCLNGNNQIVQINGMRTFNEIEAPQYIMEGCFIRVRAALGTDSRNRQLLKTFSLSLQDSGTVYSWIQGKGKQLTDEQKKAADKATQNGVKAPF